MSTRKQARRVELLPLDLMPHQANIQVRRLKINMHNIQRTC